LAHQGEGLPKDFEGHLLGRDALGIHEGLDEGALMIKFREVLTQLVELDLLDLGRVLHAVELLIKIVVKRHFCSLR